MAFCLSLCTPIRPKYKQHIRALYPDQKDVDQLSRDPNADTNAPTYTTLTDPLATPRNLSELTHYAQLYPNRLNRIGRYLLKQLRRDLSTSQHRRVHLIMAAFAGLIDACHTDDTLILYDDSVCEAIAALISHPYVDHRIVAVSTLCKLLHYADDSSDWSKYNNFFAPLTAMATYADAQHNAAQQRRVRLSGLKGIKALVIHFDRALLLQHFGELIPAVQANIPADYGSAVSPDMALTRTASDSMGGDVSDDDDDHHNIQVNVSEAALTSTALSTLGLIAAAPNLADFECVLNPTFNSLHRQQWRPVQRCVAILLVLANESQLGNGDVVVYRIIKTALTASNENDSAGTKVRLLNIAALVVSSMRVTISHWLNVTELLFSHIDHATIINQRGDGVIDAILNFFSAYSRRLTSGRDSTTMILHLAKQAYLHGNPIRSDKTPNTQPSNITQSPLATSHKLTKLILLQSALIVSMTWSDLSMDNPAPDSLIRVLLSCTITETDPDLRRVVYAIIINLLLPPLDEFISTENNDNRQTSNSTAPLIDQNRQAVLALTSLDSAKVKRFFDALLESKLQLDQNNGSGAGLNDDAANATSASDMPTGLPSSSSMNGLGSNSAISSLTLGGSNVSPKNRPNHLVLSIQDQKWITTVLYYELTASIHSNTGTEDPLPATDEIVYDEPSVVAHDDAHTASRKHTDTQLNVSTNVGPSQAVDHNTIAIITADGETHAPAATLTQTITPPQTAQSSPSVQQLSRGLGKGLSSAQCYASSFDLLLIMLHMHTRSLHWHMPLITSLQQLVTAHSKLTTLLTVKRCQTFIAAYLLYVGKVFALSDDTTVRSNAVLLEDMMNSTTQDTSDTSVDLTIDPQNGLIVRLAGSAPSTDASSVPPPSTLSYDFDAANRLVARLLADQSLMTPNAKDGDTGTVSSLADGGDNETENARLNEIVSALQAPFEPFNITYLVPHGGLKREPSQSWAPTHLIGDRPRGSSFDSATHRDSLNRANSITGFDRESSGSTPGGKQTSSNTADALRATGGPISPLSNVTEESSFGLDGNESFATLCNLVQNNTMKSKSAFDAFIHNMIFSNKVTGAQQSSIVQHNAAMEKTSEVMDRRINNVSKNITSTTLNGISRSNGVEMNSVSSTTTNGINTLSDDDVTTPRQQTVLTMDYPQLTSFDLYANDTIL